MLKEDLDLLSQSVVLINEFLDLAGVLSDFGLRVSITSGVVVVG